MGTVRGTMATWWQVATPSTWARLGAASVRIGMRMFRNMCRSFTLVGAVLLLVAGLLACSRDESTNGEKLYALNLPTATVQRLQVYELLRDGDALFVAGKAESGSVLIRWDAESGSEVLIDREDFPADLMPTTFDIVDDEVYFLFFAGVEDTSQNAARARIGKWTGSGWDWLQVGGQQLPQLPVGFVDSSDESLLDLINGKICAWREEPPRVFDLLQGGGALADERRENGGIVTWLTKSGDEWFGMYFRGEFGGAAAEGNPAKGGLVRAEPKRIRSLWKRDTSGEWQLVHKLPEGTAIASLHAVSGELYVLVGGSAKSRTLETSSARLHFINPAGLAGSGKPLREGMGFVRRSSEPLVWIQEGKVVNVYRISHDSNAQEILGGTSRTERPLDKTLGEESHASSLKGDWAAGAREVATLVGHEASVSCSAFSRDGSYVATASLDSTARLWDAAGGKELAVMAAEPEDWMDPLVFSPNGRYLASGSMKGTTARLWTIPSGDLVATLSGHRKEIPDIAFSPDGRYLATSSLDHTAKLWEVSSGDLIGTLDGHDMWVVAVEFSPDGRYLATGSYDQTAKLWAVPSGELVATMAVDGESWRSHWVLDVAFSPDGQYLATRNCDGAARLWEIPSGKLTATMNGHAGDVSCIAFSPDGVLLATGSEDKTAKLWEVPSGRLLATLKGHSDRVVSLAFSPDGRVLATGSLDNTARLWLVPSGKLITTLSAHRSSVDSVAFSPNGQCLVTASGDGTAKLWEPAVE